MGKFMGTALITGGTGTFGAAFAADCISRGISRTCIYSRGEHRQADLRARLGDDPRLRWMIGDVRDLARLRRAMRGCDIVVHAAALKRVEVGEYNPSEMVATNVGGAMNVIAAAHDECVQRVVAISTDKAVAPVNAYGATKMLAERLFLAEQHPRTRFTVVRYGNVAGSAGSVIPLWRSMIAAGALEVPVTDPDCTRYWMHIHDAIDLVWRALAQWGSGILLPHALRAYRVGDLAEAMGVGMRVTGLAEHEKRHETLDGHTDSSQARRMSIDELKEGLMHV